jgi:uncharacterized repeat protein (TIGR01451 family)
MKRILTSLAGITLLLGLSLYWLYPGSQGADPALARQSGQQRSAGAQQAAASQAAPEFYVSEAAVPGLSPAVRDLPPVPADFYLDREIFPRHNPLLLDAGMGAFDISGRAPDPLPAAGVGRGNVPTPALSFEGANRSQAGGYSPPDTVGDVGPNHYVQMVNVVFTIFDKSGTLLAGPTPFNQLFAGQGNACETRNDGDPIVVYDRRADRWLLSQFTWPTGMCIAVSTGSDPSGSYHLYRFNTAQFPDYFKFGVWPDGYYMAANESNYTAYAFDRTKMLAGAAATYQRFAGGTNLYLPSDLDGATPPPPASPNYFYTFKSGASHGGVDRLEIWEFAVDFATPANSSFNLAQSIPITPFNYTVCGWFNFNCIRQLGTAQRLDAVSEWPMWRLPYRNFGSHEVLVGNFSIDVTGTQVAGIRWFELRRTGGGAWVLHQEGTHAPDAHSRWMGSIAMDQAGNIALGYSVSSLNMYPSIRYTIRTPDDSLGTLRSEVSLIEGTTFQSGTNRWGDYSSLNVDPADDCTFWYTNEYLLSGSTSNWRTRIGAFKVPGCGEEEPDPEADLAVSKSVDPATVLVGSNVTFTLSVFNHGPDTATGVVLIDALPAGLSFVAASTGAGACSETSAVVTCQLDDLALSEQISVLIVATAVTSGVILNTAHVSALEPDPVLTNNTAFATVSILENQAPLADAGPDQLVIVQESVILDGSNSSDPDGHLPLSYGWTQTGGPGVALSSATAVMPTFAAPAGRTVLTFSLVVTDSLGLASLPDEVVVTVQQPEMAVEKQADVSSAAVGQTITYVYTITNNGDVPLYQVTAEDDRLGPLFSEPQTLAVGEAISQSLAYTVVEGDLPGPLVNNVTVTAVPPAGNPIMVAAVASVTLEEPHRLLFLPYIATADAAPAAARPLSGGR